VPVAFGRLTFDDERHRKLEVRRREARSEKRHKDEEEGRRKTIANAAHVFSLLTYAILASFQLHPSAFPFTGCVTAPDATGSLSTAERSPGVVN